MRLFCKMYREPDKAENGQLVLFETDDDGQNRRVIRGTPPPASSIKRVPLYVEVSCDDNAETIRETLKAMQEIEHELSTRVKNQ